ncbi:MAG: NosD domain-containing protein [Candidatus Hodarchaeales archaeon]
MFIRYCNGQNVLNNTCSGSTTRGIWLELVRNAVVINNTCYNNDGDGISLNGFSDNSEVINNNCFSNGGRGLYIRLSSNTKKIILARKIVEEYHFTVLTRLP